MRAGFFMCHSMQAYGIFPDLMIEPKRLVIY